MYVFRKSRMDDLDRVNIYAENHFFFFLLFIEEYKCSILNHVILYYILWVHVIVV